MLLSKREVGNGNERKAWERNDVGIERKAWERREAKTDRKAWPP